MARAGHVAKTLYQSKIDSEFVKYRLTFREFHTYRSKLPWYRRALLLYKAPNPNAAVNKFIFHLMLVLNITEIIFLPVLLVKVPALDHPPPTWLMVLNHTHHMVAILILLAILIISLCVVVGLYVLYRRRVIKYENDPRYYIYQDDPDTGLA